MRFLLWPWPLVSYHPASPADPICASPRLALELAANPLCQYACLTRRCGTTWVCQIVQSLRSRGDMDFEEINLVGRAAETPRPSRRWFPRTPCTNRQPASLIAFRSSSRQLEWQRPLLCLPGEPGHLLLCSHATRPHRPSLQAIPCLEMAWDGGYGEPDQPQRWQPRVFKTHWWVAGQLGVAWRGVVSMHVWCRRCVWAGQLEAQAASRAVRRARV